MVRRYDRGLDATMDTCHTLVRRLSERVAAVPAVPSVPSGPTPSTDLAAALQDVVDDVAELLSAPTVLEDTGFGLVAYCSQDVDVDPVRTASILTRTATDDVRAYFLDQGIATATGPVHVPGDEARQIAARACLPARSGGATHGYLWVLEPRDRIDAGRLAEAVGLAERAGSLLALRRQGSDERERLTAALVSGDEQAAVQAAAELTGRGDLSPGDPIAVSVTRDGGGSGPGQVRVWPAPAAPDRLAAVTRRVTRQLGAGQAAGLGTPGPAGAGLLRSRQEADWAARVALGRPGLAPVATWSRLGFYRVVAQGIGEVEALIASTPAGPFRTRAEEDLVRTALTYLDEAGHAARTAAALSIHRQTLYYRLDKIRQLSGVDLDQGEGRLQLHLGLALGEVLPFLEAG